MNLVPTTVTAALAGIFSGLTWPLIWPLLRGGATAGSLWLMLGTVVLVALPAHAFVVGFKRNQVAGAATVDSALLVRVGAWLACAAGSAVLVSMYRGTL
jgi:hypothetical protein